MPDPHAGVVVDVEREHLGVEPLVAEHLGQVALVGVAHGRVHAVAAPAERQRARGSRTRCCTP